MCKIVNADDQTAALTHAELRCASCGELLRAAEVDVELRPGAEPVTVGADHIGVDYQEAGATTGGPMKITTLLATPER